MWNLCDIPESKHEDKVLFVPDKNLKCNIYKESTEEATYIGTTEIDGIEKHKIKLLNTNKFMVNRELLF